MLKPNDLEAVSMAYDKPMRELENRIMQDIIRRLKANGNEITRAADWQINRLYELGMSKKDIETFIQQSLNLSDEDVHAMYEKAIETDYLRNAALYAASGMEQIPFAENAGLQQMLHAISGQTYGTLQNITNSLGFSTRNAAGRLVFQPIADYYQKTLDGAMLDIASGAFDYNTVLKRIVSEMTNSGLRTVDYATGWANRVDVAARRAVMTGISQLTAKVSEDNAAALDTEYFEVSWHGGARPEHQVWQGKVYSKAQLASVCGLGTVTGLCGANCYHGYYPFIPGISERTYTDEELAKMNAEENTPKEFGGRQYTKYEALQRQRRLETTMRAQKQQIALLESGGADEDTLTAAKGRYRTMSYEYTRFSKAMGLPQQRERIRVSGDFVPKVGARKTGTVSEAERAELLKNPLTSEGRSGIIKVEEEQKEIIVKDIDKLKNSGMKEADYNEYMGIIKSHENQDVKRIYNEYADDISSIKLSNTGYYRPGNNSLVFDYPQQRYIDNGINKYSTLAHEYGHYFDAKASFENVHYKEIEAIHENVPFGDKFFSKVPSSSDEFLAAVRMDKEYLRSIGFSKLKDEMYSHDGSSGVQDAIDGMFIGKDYRIRWGHGEDYYNWKYNSLKDIGKIGKTHSEKHLQSVYKSLGFDASSQAKVKSICRNYETASEMWANIMSAIVCGGEELEYVKQYLPNSYNAMIEILKGVK